MRLLPGRVNMLPWLSLCVLSARAYGLEILDGVYNDISDAAGFAAECAQARDFGFDGKTLIHRTRSAPATKRSRRLPTRSRRRATLYRGI